MARGASIVKIREYFRTASLDEAEVVLQLVTKDVAERQTVVSPPIPNVPRKRRARRAKAVTAQRSLEQAQAAGVAD